MSLCAQQLRKRHATLCRKWLTRHFITFWNLNMQIGAKDGENALDACPFEVSIKLDQIA